MHTLQATGPNFGGLCGLLKCCSFHFKRLTVHVLILCQHTSQSNDIHEVKEEETYVGHTGYISLAWERMRRKV